MAELDIGKIMNGAGPSPVGVDLVIVGDRSRISLGPEYSRLMAWTIQKHRATRGDRGSGVNAVTAFCFVTNSGHENNERFWSGDPWDDPFWNISQLACLQKEPGHGVAPEFPARFRSLSLVLTLPLHSLSRVK